MIVIDPGITKTFEECRYIGDVITKSFLFSDFSTDDAIFCRISGDDLEFVMERSPDAGTKTLLEKSKGYLKGKLNELESSCCLSVIVENDIGKTKTTEVRLIFDLTHGRILDWAFYSTPMFNIFKDKEKIIVAILKTEDETKYTLGSLIYEKSDCLPMLATFSNFSKNFLKPLGIVSNNRPGLVAAIKVYTRMRASDEIKVVINTYSQYSNLIRSHAEMELSNKLVGDFFEALGKRVTTKLDSEKSGEVASTTKQLFLPGHHPIDTKVRKFILSAFVNSTDKERFMNNALKYGEFEFAIDIIPYSSMFKSCTGTPTRWILFKTDDETIFEKKEDGTRKSESIQQELIEHIGYDKITVCRGR